MILTSFNDPDGGTVFDQLLPPDDDLVPFVYPLKDLHELVLFVAKGDRPPEQSPGAVAVIAAPVARGRKGTFRKELAAARAAGLHRARVGGRAVNLADRLVLDPRRGHRIDVLVDRLALRSGAEDRLREQVAARPEDEATAIVFAATDPANPFGTAIQWPEVPDECLRPQRAAGARVIVADGELIAFLGRTVQQLTTFLPDNEPQRTQATQAMAKALARLATGSEAVFLARIDGRPPGGNGAGPGQL